MIDRFGWVVQWGLTLGIGTLLWPRLGGWTLLVAPVIGVLGVLTLATVAGWVRR